MEITRAELDKVLSEMTLLHNKLMKMGLYRTYQAMHLAVKEIGWEISDIVSGEHPTGLEENLKEENHD